MERWQLTCHISWYQIFWNKSRDPSTTLDLILFHFPLICHFESMWGYKVTRNNIEYTRLIRWTSWVEIIHLQGYQFEWSYWHNATPGQQVLVCYHCLQISQLVYEHLHKHHQYTWYYIVPFVWEVKVACRTNADVKRQHITPKDNFYPRLIHTGITKFIFYL